MEFDPVTQGLVGAMGALWTRVAVFIPNLIGAMVLVLLGFVVAKLLDTLLSKVLAKIGLDRLMAGTGLTKMIGRVGIQVSVSTLIGKIVYWFILLVFLVSAAELLGLERVSATLDVLALFMPLFRALRVVTLLRHIPLFAGGSGAAVRGSVGLVATFVGIALMAMATSYEMLLIAAAIVGRLEGRVGSGFALAIRRPSAGPSSGAGPT